MSAYLLSVARARVGLARLKAAAEEVQRAVRALRQSGQRRNSAARRSDSTVAPHKIFLIACIFFLRARTDLVFFEKCTCLAEMNGEAHFRRTREKN